MPTTESPSPPPTAWRGLERASVGQLRSTAANAPMEAAQDGDGTARTFRAVFVNFGVRNAFGDVWEPGCLTAGAPVLVGPYGHALLGWEAGLPPIGIGTIEQTESEGLIAGEFFTSPQAEAHYEAVRRTPMQEWSAIYYVRDWRIETLDDEETRYISRVDIASVDPVLRGANPDTRTIEVNAAPAVPPDATDPVFHRARSRLAFATFATQEGIPTWLSPTT